MAGKFCGWEMCSQQKGLDVKGCGKSFCCHEHLACWAIKQVVTKSGQLPFSSTKEKKIADEVGGIVQSFTGE